MLAAQLSGTPTDLPRNWLNPNGKVGDELLDRGHCSGAMAVRTDEDLRVDAGGESELAADVRTEGDDRRGVVDIG